MKSSVKNTEYKFIVYALWLHNRTRASISSCIFIAYQHKFDHVSAEFVVVSYKIVYCCLG